MPRNYVKKTDNANMGRPRKQISKDEFEKLCMLQCTEEEVLAFFGCSSDTLYEWIRREYGEGQTYRRIFMEKRQHGLISLRRSMLHNALYGGKSKTGDIAMQIFLAKNWLGMSDKVEEKVEERVQIVQDLEDD